MAPDITIEEALAHLNKVSWERMRAEHMGWTFGKPSIQPAFHGAYQMRMTFTCVCGRQELFSYVVPHLAMFSHVDPVRALERAGSFTRAHLLSDGYTEDQVREIESRGEEFDRITREHWELEMLKAGGYDEFRRRRIEERS